MDPPKGILLGQEGKQELVGWVAEDKCAGSACKVYCVTPSSLLSILLDLCRRSLCVGYVCHLKDEVGEACFKDGKHNEPFFFM